MNLIKSKKTLSAEIKSIDLSKDLKVDQINFIQKAWDENLVLIFKFTIFLSFFLL